MAENVLTGKKQQFVDGLAGGDPVGKVAAAVGISGRTARRWMHDQTVTDALHAAQDGRLRELAAVSIALALDGAQVLSDILGDKNAPPYVRLGAAKAALDAGLKMSDVVALVDRLDRVKRLLEEQGK